MPQMIYLLLYLIVAEALVIVLLYVINMYQTIPRPIAVAVIVVVAIVVILWMLPLGSGRLGPP